MLERQFRRYFERATRQPGVPGENLLRLLELRLDNVVYRLGLASTRAQARQFGTHGHVHVNGRKVDRPSYQVSPGDVVSLRPGTRIEPVVHRAAEQVGAVPAWLLADPDNHTGRVERLPAREEIDAPVSEQLIVELYSK